MKVHEAVAGEGGRVTLAGQVVVRPAGLVGVNVTVPVNDPTAVTVTVVAAPVAPVLKFTGLVAEILKSETPEGETTAATLVALDAVPTVPVIFTV
ncbi:hypothetical protein E6H37_07380 [Candidatus Bathyarchaeota archaeon]|nr:MAG: hypothetical protein E6H37_07380 [Candidatus Bathyarchaeota archaeon]